jgi:very-short-patch-repair endonuclease
MNKFSNHKLTPNAKVLRKNMTKQERHLWYDFLKTLPITIHRQKVIGSYIVDFYCASKKIVIELDGSQHFENEGQEKDKLRDEYLNKSGIKVLRYSNLDIDRNFEGVCTDILKHISNEE